MPSSSPVTVTLCGVFQFELSNVSEFVDRDPWAGFPLTSEMVTGADGAVVSCTLNEAFAPCADVINEVGLTMNPAAEVFTFVTSMAGIATPLYVASVLEAVPVI